VGLEHERLFVEAARHPGLIRDDDNGEPGAIEESYRVDGVGEEGDALEPIQVPGFLQQRAVAVDENGGPHAAGPCAPARASSRRITASKTTSTLMPRMQR
jgi:hypothetical protein